MASAETNLDVTTAPQDPDMKQRRGLSKVMMRMRPDQRIIALMLVYVTVFLDLLGVTILTPVLPFLVGTKPHPDMFTIDDTGLDPGFAASLISFTYAGAQFISGLLFGLISDRIGRKPLLVASLLGGAVGYGLQGMAISLKHFPLLLVFRILTGLFGGSRGVATAYIMDVAWPEERAKLVGLISLSGTLAMQFGPVLGGALGNVSLPLPCYFSAGISAVGTALVWGFVAEVHQAGARPPVGRDGLPRKERVDCVAMGLSAGFSFILGLWMSSFVLAFALLLPARYDFDPNQVGLAALGDGVALFVGNPIYLMLVRRLSVPMIGAMGCSLMVLVTACPFLELVPQFVLRYISMVGGPLSGPCPSAIVGLIAPASRRGALTGFTVAIQALGRAVGPLVVGATFDANDQLPFITAGAAALVGLVLNLLLLPRVPRPQAEQPMAAAAGVLEAGELGGAAEVNPEPSLPGSDLLSEHTKELVQRLREWQKRLQQRLEKGQATDTVLEDPLPTAERRACAQEELATWLVELLEHHNYNRWPDHLEGMKLILFNSFPPLSNGSTVERLTDVITVLEGHINMAEQSTLFDGAEDLQPLL